MYKDHYLMFRIEDDVEFSDYCRENKVKFNIFDDARGNTSAFIEYNVRRQYYLYTLMEQADCIHIFPAKRNGRRDVDLYEVGARNDLDLGPIGELYSFFECDIKNHETWCRCRRTGEYFDINFDEPANQPHELTRILFDAVYGDPR